MSNDDDTDIYSMLCVLGHIDGLMQKGRNPISNTLELLLFCITPSMYTLYVIMYMNMIWSLTISQNILSVFSRKDAEHVP